MPPAFGPAPSLSPASAHSKGPGDRALEMGIGNGSPRTHPHRRGVFGEATLDHGALRAPLLTISTHSFP